MILALAFLSLISSPLEGWRDDLRLKGFDAVIFPLYGCPHLLAHLPARNAQRQKALLLHSTYDPQKEDSESDVNFLKARVHLESLRDIRPETRDLYVLVSCGGSHTISFVHHFLGPLQNLQINLSTMEKVQIASIQKLFPHLKEISFVWNEGPLLDPFSFSPWILAPISTAQTGLWVGRIKFLAYAASGSEVVSEMNEWAELQTKRLGLMDAMTLENTSSAWSFSPLPPEADELVSRFKKFESFFDRLVDGFFPHRFFSQRSWPAVGLEKWTVRGFSDFDKDRKAILDLELSFTKGQEIEEIEQKVRQRISQIMGRNMAFDLESLHFNRFYRSPFEGHEAKAFDSVLPKFPQILPAPVISSEFTEAYVFRDAGRSVFEFTPYRAAEPFFPASQPQDFAFSEKNLKEAVGIESRLLKELVRSQ